MLTKHVTVVIALGFVATLGLAAGAFASQPLKIVDFPTAGLYERGEYGIDISVYSEGGLALGLGVGFARFLSFGITYGGQNVIGGGSPHMNPRPEVNVRARIVDENVLLPAIAVGFDSQGYGKFGKYHDEDDTTGTNYEERYLVKSRGLYAVASKNWDLVGPLSLHGGLSYSLENKNDKDPTLFVGAIKTFAEVVDLAAEFDFASNDNEGKSTIVENHGYLDASVAWHINENFVLALQVRDIVSSGKHLGGEVRKWNRGLGITYRARL
jgi:hypothetical protein